MSDFSGKECEGSQLVSHLMNCKEGRAAISPFACLSGNFDSDLLQVHDSEHVSEKCHVFMKDPI